ncbi:MAG TPA: flagellar hook-associated protein FlgK [Terracidiphilus sp.]|jgi:flagellar hook-associated protein 1 FlgK|nr:flagellar hook-associated protein FlgK [Terracidiphilus sp.]
MGTISSAFSIITGALNADQSGLSIVAGNVANANTPGYTRETPNWEENSPVTINGLTYGTGVTETGATSIRDRVLEQRLDQQQQLASASTTRLAALNGLQAVFTPDSGSSGSTAGDIGSDVTGFFNSFASLEDNPSNNALRQQVLSTATTLAGDISNVASSVNQQKAALDQEAAGVATQVNALTASIAQLNLQIQSSSPNAGAGPLEDQRQQDLSQLSQLIGINQVTTENNGLTITTTFGQTLVAEGTSTALDTGLVNGVTDFFIGGADVTKALASGGGSLGGYLTARDKDIPSVMGALDQLAFGISTEVNAQNAKGVDLSGNPGAAIFSQPAQMAGSAEQMSVAMTDPGKIAAAAAGQGTGDNSNATALAGLASSSDPPILNGLVLPGGVVLAAGQTLLSGLTPSNYYSGFVTTLGSTVSQVQTENTAQNASVSQLQTQNNTLSQVNLNDEASAMTTLERSYQAASQVFSMLNTILAAALNLGEQSTVA